MPKVPDRPLSLGEKLQSQRLSSHKRNNRHNHYKQRKTALRKKQNIKNYYADKEYQTRIALWIKDWV